MKVSESLNHTQNDLPDASEINEMTVGPFCKETDIDWLPVEIYRCSFIDETTFKLELDGNGWTLI